MKGLDTLYKKGNDIFKKKIKEFRPDFEKLLFCFLRLDYWWKNDILHIGERD